MSESVTIAGYVTTVDGVEYTAPFRIKSIRSSCNGLEIAFDRFDVVNQCEHCHRFDTKPTIAHSWQEAIDRGLLVRAPEKS